jgi:hypothetical protein
MRARWTLIVLTFLAVGFMTLQAQAQTVYNPQEAEGLLSSPATGAHELVVLKGPRKFVSAQLSKQGGTNDITFVILEIDGKTVVNGSIAGYRNRAQTQSNPSGSMLLQSSTQKTVTIGFPFPLAYQSELRLSVDITESGVLQILGTVIHGE